MIGGGGSSCGDADHGIGITETGAASFIEAGGSATESRGTEYDFGYDRKRSIPVLFVKPVDLLKVTSLSKHRAQIFP